MKPDFFTSEPRRAKRFQPQSKAERGVKKVRGYATLIALCLVFLLPVGLAWLTLQQGWFTKGVNNHGQWLTGQVAADSQWRLIIPQAAHCASCTDVEPLMAQLILTLGRDAKRVRLMLTPASTELEAGFVYIADPPGTLIMRYPFLESHPSPQGLLFQQQLAPNPPSNNRVMAKALLEDLRRLLTYSRAG